MVELNAIENKKGEYLSLDQFLNLEYKENSRETLKKDLAFIINNFHNLTSELDIEPATNFENFVVEYESTTLQSGSNRTTTVRTPAPREQDINEANINPHNTYAKAQFKELKEVAQPLFHSSDANKYLRMTQNVLRESIESKESEG